MAERGKMKLMKYDKKDQIKDVNDKTKLFLGERKNANTLVDIMTIFESTDEGVIQACVRAVHKVFVFLISTKEMYIAKPPSDESLEDLSAEEKYKIWLQERYTDCREKLLELLAHPNRQIQELALCTLLKFVLSEGQTPLRKIAEKHVTFPVKFFEQVVWSLLSSEIDCSSLITRFQEYLEYDDVRYYTMKKTLKLLKDGDKLDSGNTYLKNVSTLLENLSMPLTADDGKLDKFLIHVPESETKLKIGLLKEHRKIYTTVWIEFLKFKLPNSLYKNILVILSDKIMPHMSNPLFLSDFLTASYNIGGAVSLLALNGLFILVHSFNLDYPEFFPKLYALLEPSVFHVKYRSRFFFLLDLFLTSTHLPSYLVAAFAKKLARIALTAPPNGLTVVIPFIYNLIKRHPAIKVLIHRPDGPSDVETDPYDSQEPDPAKCKAMDSSLWELKTLQSHYHHTVSLKASKIDTNLPDNEIDLSERLETNISDLFQIEIKKKANTVPITYERPRGLFGNKEDKLKELWLLE